MRLCDSRLQAHRASKQLYTFCGPRSGTTKTSCQAHAAAQEPDLLSRRQAAHIMIAVGLGLPMVCPGSAKAIGFKKELKKKKISEDDYAVLEANGLRYYDLEEGGSGQPIQPGDKVVVHFDCIYRGLDVVSSRAARLLGGNRTIAEPYEYVVGEPVLGQQLKKINDAANGLFAGAAGPKPPPALSLAVVGMKKGGKRSLIVDSPELGYGSKGVGEIPANATFELKVEVLEVFPRKS